ncbi:hypothetical protein J6590_026114 [Homalodisca vitripennis]|nr:hypothetical protein J6590_026114 [Homalodisca vitripennis]
MMVSRWGNSSGKAGARVPGVPCEPASGLTGVPRSPVKPAHEPHRPALLDADFLLLWRGLRHRAMTGAPITACLSAHPSAGLPTSIPAPLTLVLSPTEQRLVQHPVLTRPVVLSAKERHKPALSLSLGSNVRVLNLRPSALPRYFIIPDAK